LFGQNFNFVVNLCQYAATNSAADKLNCETDEQTILNYLPTINVVYKSVHQYFSSDTYIETKTMDYISDGRIFSGFMAPVTATPDSRYYTPI